MKSVLVSWQTQDQNMPAGTPAPHHFKVALALQEVDVDIALREHMFDNVEPGVMAGFIAVCAADGTELAVPITFSVDVPVDPPDVIVPVPVMISGVVQ